MDNLIQKELRRESQAIEDGFARLMRDEQERCDFGDGSNTTYARSIKKQLVTDTIKYLTEQVELASDPKNRMKNVHLRTSNATAAIQQCLGINLVCKKNKDGEYESHISKRRRDYFDLRKAVFIAVQLIIDSSLSPIVKTTRISPKHEDMKSTSVQRTLTQLRDIVGTKIQQEVRHAAVQHNMPGFFAHADSFASGDYSSEQMRSSTYYWEQTMKNLFQEKAAQISQDTSKPDDIKRAEIDLLTWRPWSRTQRVHVGAWLLDGVLKVSRDLNLFQTKTIKSGENYEDTKTGEFIELTKEADELRHEFLNDLEQYCWREQPMLCEPIDNTATKLKGFLMPAMWIQPPGRAGRLKMGQEHLDFINNMQKIPYKINPFVADLMDILVKQEMKLGKFTPEFFKAPPTVAQMLGYGSVPDKDEQDRLVYSHPDFAKSKRERSKEISRKRKLVLDGTSSRELHKLVTKNRDIDKFWIPLFWDFRGRVYYRVPFLNPQGTDPGKGVLEFANPTKVDSRTKYYLQLSISAAAGKDKLPYDERVDWVLRNEKHIQNVATMLDKGDFQSAIGFLESVDDPFDFAAACREYYLCFLAPIDQRRNYTHYRCALDATAQGSQIISGLRRSRSGASKVNVLKTDRPNDVYMNLWDEIIDQAVYFGGTKDTKDWGFPKDIGIKIKRLGFTAKPTHGKVSFRPALLKWLKQSGAGRKIAKSGVLMTAQYGSGVERQMLDILDILVTLPKNRRFNEDELMCIFHVLKSSTDKVASITAFVNWMRDRVLASLDNGAKTFYLPSPNGNVCMMRYSQTVKTLIKTFHHGSIQLDPLTNKFSHLDKTQTPEKSDWMKACAANAIHTLDATLLSQAFHDWQFNLSTIHDSIASSPGLAMDVVVRRYKTAFIKTVEWDFWTAVYEANKLPTHIDGEEDPELRDIVIGDLDTSEINDANYLIC